MAIKNIKTLLTQITSFPAAVEAKLPEGAPNVSTMLRDAAGKIPETPDFPVEIPDLPAAPAFPELPGTPAGLARTYVTEVEVTPTPAPAASAGVTKPLGEEILS